MRVEVFCYTLSKLGSRQCDKALFLEVMRVIPCLSVGRQRRKAKEGGRRGRYWIEYHISYAPSVVDTFHYYYVTSLNLQCLCQPVPP